MKTHVWSNKIELAEQQFRKLSGNKQWLAGVMMMHRAATYLQARGSPAPPG